MKPGRTAVRMSSASLLLYIAEPRAPMSSARNDGCCNLSALLTLPGSGRLRTQRCGVKEQKIDGQDEYRPPNSFKA